MSNNNNPNINDNSNARIYNLTNEFFIFLNDKNNYNQREVNTLEISNEEMKQFLSDF